MFTPDQLAAILIALDLHFGITPVANTPVPGGFMGVVNIEDTPLELDALTFTNTLQGTKAADAVATIAAIQSEFLTAEFRGMDLATFFKSQGIN